MPSIRELFELAKQCYEQSNSTLDPKAKKIFEDMSEQYLKRADQLSRIETIQAVFPNVKKLG